MNNKEMTDVMEDIFTRLSDEAKRGSCTPQELTDLARAMLAIYEAIVYGR